MKVTFKFFNVWIEHASFLELVENVWTQHYDNRVMKKIWYKLKALQPVLRQLNRKEFQFIGQQIEKSRMELTVIQDQLYS